MPDQPTARLYLHHGARYRIVCAAGAVIMSTTWDETAMAFLVNSRARTLIPFDEVTRIAEFCDYRHPTKAPRSDHQLRWHPTACCYLDKHAPADRLAAQPKRRRSARTQPATPRASATTPWVHPYARRSIGARPSSL
jgi:hypothetical protein